MASTFVPFHEKLRPAQFLGLTFYVTGGRLRFGRRNALHEYPFRDVVWVEDLGRQARRIQLSAFLLGDDVIAQRAKLITAAERAIGGELQHPTLGRVTVALMEVETGESFDAGRVIEVLLSFIEQGQRQFPDAVAATGQASKAAAAASSSAAAASFGAACGPALTGPSPRDAAGAVAGGFGDAASAAGRNATSLVSMTAVLPSSIGSLVRSGSGILSSQAVVGAVSDVQGLIGLAAAGRQEIVGAAQRLNSIAVTLTAGTVMAFSTAVKGVVDAVRLVAATPGDALRALKQMAAYNPLGGGTGDALTVHVASSDLVRRASVIGVVEAASDYQPQTLDEAAALRADVLALLNAEVDAAGDAGDDATYAAFRSMRSAIVQQLNAAGASLPTLVQVDLGSSLPSLVLAQMRYRDASRADEVALRAGAINPAFLPLSMQLLSE